MDSLDVSSPILIWGSFVRTWSRMLVLSMLSIWDVYSAKQVFLYVPPGGVQPDVEKKIVVQNLLKNVSALALVGVGNILSGIVCKGVFWNDFQLSEVALGCCVAVLMESTWTGIEECYIHVEDGEH